ncbi:MAG: rod shape-determining protein MreD [Candidatus Aminicenantes bacterium]|nr:rod shape-determining protein MreD [Candidatus Aminicenantes bacterium]
MKDFVKVSLGIIIAFLFYTVLNKISPSLILLFNVFSLVVIYFAVKKNEIFGACLGAFCGLIQDSFSLGVFGVAGLAKTVAGFTAGYISKKVDTVPFLRSFIFILLLISFEFVIWALLYSFIFSESINTGGGLIFFQPLGTALVGSILFFFLRKFKRSKS